MNGFCATTVAYKAPMAREGYRTMRYEPVPITPAVLTWARERAGFTIEEASQTFAKIYLWETGEALPTYPQLEALADKFKLPVAVFFFPEPPDLPPISESFRTLPDAEFDQLPRRVRFLLRKASALQMNRSELCQGQNPSERLITHYLSFQSDVDLATMTSQVRDYIGIPIEEQCPWSTDDDALKTWRTALLDVGIFVFKDAFREKAYSGFCLSPFKVPTC
jgi:transcriptional regulator with XRE-family HTH domain